MGLFGGRRKERARDEPIAKEARTKEALKGRQLRRALTVRRGDVSLASNEAIYAAVSRIANSFGSMPMHLYKDGEVQRDHPLERLLAYAPNATMTPFEWRQTMEAYRNTEGNAYAFLVPSADPTFPYPVSMDILDATRVEPMLDTANNELWYFCTMDNGQRLPIHNSRMFVVRHLCTNGYKGIRPLDVLRESLDYDARIKTFSADQLEYGLNSSMALEIPTNVGEEEKQRAIDSLRNIYTKSAGSLVVLEGGMKLNKLDRSPIDAKVLDIERITRNRVATVYNLPPHLLGDYTGVNYTSMEQELVEFASLTMLTVDTLYTDQGRRKLLTWAMCTEGYDIGIDLDALIMADTATRAEANSKAIRSAWKMPNEVRRRENLRPVPEGECLYGSKDLAPLEVIQQGSIKQGG